MMQALEKAERRQVIYSVVIVLALHICWLLSSLFLRGLEISARMLISRITLWLCFGVICWYAAKIERRPFLLWKEKRYSVGFYLVSVIIIFLIILAVSVALYIPLDAMGFKPSNMIGQLLTMPIPLKILTVVTAGVMEELVFRGYIQSRLQLLFKTPDFPVLISAAGFGLLHAAYGTLINMLIPFVIGVVFGYYYYKYRNIKVLIICHLLIDANAMFHTVAKH